MRIIVKGQNHWVQLLASKSLSTATGIKISKAVSMDALYRPKWVSQTEKRLKHLAN